MSEWKEYKLGDIATFSQGIQIDIENQFSESFEDCVRFIRIVDFTKGTENEIRYIKNPGEKYIVKSDDLVMIRYGSQTAGKIARGFSGAIANNTFKISMDEKKSDKNFIYYFLSQQSIFNFFHNSQSSSTMPAITFGMIGDLDIELPPLPEQKTIASILSSLDDKIDLLHRQNATLEKMAETLFRQWFVEEAKDDWEKGPLGDFVNIVYGKNLPTKNLLPSGYPVFGGNGQIGFFDKYIYESPQVLVSCRGEASGVVNISLKKAYVTNNSLILEIGKRPEITFEYLKYSSLNTDFKTYVSGSAQPQITIEGLSPTEFVLPPSNLINRFSEVVRVWEQKRTNNQIQIRTLTALRDTLLPKLMSGEVRVNN